jgi:hypothetical protein
MKLWITLLAVGIVWIFGTLPWIAIGGYLCSHEPPLACPNPAQFWQKVRVIILVDLLFIGLGGWSIQRLRRLDRPKRQRRT